MKHGRKPKKLAEKEPGLLVQLEGATVDEIVIAGEQWVPPAEHQRALDEIDQLKKAKPSNGKPGDDSKVKQHLRCPSCWGRDRGKAGKRKWVRQVNGPIQKRCYSCDKCGTEWVVEVKAEVVDDIRYETTKVVEVRKRDDDSGTEAITG